MATRCYLILLGLLLTTGLWTCRRPDAIEPIAGQLLAGNWLYIENGYSPGAGYFINKVPVNPPQVVSFTAQNTVSAFNMDVNLPFSQATIYHTDSTSYGVYLHLFDKMGKEIPPSMAIRIRNDTLRLSPPCFEGCHYGFVRLR